MIKWKLIILQMQTQQQNKNQQNSESKNNGVNQYGSVEYWQQRYRKTNGQRFDWLESFQTLKNMIVEELGPSKQKRILNVGCGNGQIQDYLYNAGYHDIINNDISKVVIDQMNLIKKQKNQQGMIYQVMDVTKMSYPNQYFDLVLDKSTLDALLCSEHPYIESANMIEQIERVMKKDGVYLAISYGAPENRIKHFQREHVSFSVQTKKLKRMSEEGQMLIHYAYICRRKQKQERSKQWKQQFYAKVLQQQREYYDEE